MSEAPTYAPIITNASRLTGKLKAAVLLVALTPDAASSVFKHLSDSEIEVLTKTISNMPTVTRDTRATVMKEFHSLVTDVTKQYPSGPAYARALLERSLGPDKAEYIMNKLEAQGKERPFSFARRVEAAQLAEFIRNEHPQTIALILAHLPSKQAGTVLSNLPSDRQVDVTRRLATLDRADPELLKEIDDVLQRRLLLVGTAEGHALGGVDLAVDVINRVDSATERTVMEGLSAQLPDLANEIRKRMFVFEDIVHLDTQSMQRIIREVEAREWALAMRTASEEVRAHIFAGMSKRLTDLVQEEMEFLGLVRLREVEEAQQHIVSAIRRLEEQGELIVSRNEPDSDVFV